MNNPSNNTTNNNNNTTNTSTPSTAPTNTALPNPWGGPAANANNNNNMGGMGQGALNPFAAMGGAGGFNPYAGMGGMGGMGGEFNQVLNYSFAHVTLVFEFYSCVCVNVDFSCQLPLTLCSYPCGIINITTTGAQDPAQAMQMLQNPMVQQMMQQMLSDPQALEQVCGFCS